MTVPYPNESINTPSFFQQYFIDPIINKVGYNSVNTIAYGILLVIGSYVLFKLFKKMGYKINMRLFKACLPFILLVSVWRVLTDAGVYAYSFLTTTPGLYVPVLLLLFPLIILAKKVENWKGWRYEWILTGVSTGLLISQLIMLGLLIPGNLQIDALLRVTYYTIISSAPILILSKYWKPLKNKFNTLMIISHLFEASVTHVSIEFYGYFEQHIIPRTLFDLTGTSLSFYALKLAILGIVIYLLDKDVKKQNKELIDFIKIIFITYGLAIGVRNLLRLSLGV